jgi:tetratricopeptide (TPR) repeat protein
MNINIQTICIVLSILLCSSCFDKYENRDKFYNLAKTSFANKQYEDSLLHIKNALRIDPQFASGYILLGMIASQNKKFNSAKKNYLKALKIDCNSVDANIGLAEACIYLNQYQESSQYIDNVIKIDSENTAIKFFQGILLFQEQRFADSIQILHKIPQHELTSDGYILIAQNYMKLGNPGLAVHYLLRGISSSIDDKNILHLALAKIYESKSDLDNALVHYKIVATNGGDMQVYRYSLADFYLRNGYVKDAESTLTELVAASYDIYALKALINLFIQKAEIENAEQFIIDYENHYSDKKDLKLFLIEFYMNQNSLEKAREKLEKELLIESSIPLKNRYRKLLARIFKSTHENEKVIECMTEILKDDPSDCDALMFFAQRDSLDGNFDQAVFKYRQIIHLEPNTDRSYLGLAQLYLVRSDDTMARQVLFECIQNNKSSAARILLAKIFETNNQLDKAIEQIRLVPELLTSRINLFSQLIQLEIRNKNLSQAEKDLLDVLKYEPYRHFAHLALSKLYALQGLFDKAHAIINPLTEEDTIHIPCIVQKISLFIDQKKFSDALYFIDKKVLDEALALFLKGELVLAKNDTNRAVKLFENSFEMNQNRFVVMKLLNLYVQNRQISDAIDIAKRYVKSHDRDSQVLFLLGYLYELSGEYEYAVTYYKRSLQSNPEYLPALNNLAYLYAEKFPTRTNLEYALHIIRQGLFTPNSQLLDTLGWIYFQLGDIEHSLEIFKTVASWPDVSPVVFYHLGATYIRDGQTELGRKWLTKSVNAHVDFPEKNSARKLLGEI